MTLAPFETVHVQGVSKVFRHDKWISAITEPPNISYSNSEVNNSGYTWLTPGSRKVSFSLCDVTSKLVTIEAKMVIANLSAANVVLAKPALGSAI